MNLARKILLLAAIPVAIVACSEKSQPPLTPERNSLRMNITGLVIQGPSTVTQWETCSWLAVPSGGTAPYTYAWTVLNGTGAASVTNDNVWTGYTPWTSTMKLTVTVTDALGATRTATKNVIGVYSGPPPCVTYD